MIKQIICINWGSKYGAPYINRLYGMISRNITPPFSVICFTDDATGVRKEVACIPLPELNCELPLNTKGIWSKARLWDQDLNGVEGVVLFLDLDVVIVGSLDGFFEFGDPDDVILARNWIRPLEKLGQTSVYRFPVGKLHPLKDLFLENPQGIADKYKYEQRFVTRMAPGGIKFWPSNWVSHFRLDCIKTWPTNYFRVPAPRKDCKIVIFPGNLNPPDAILGCWSSKDQANPPLTHLKLAFSKDRRESFTRHIRHFILPTPWVEDLWKE